METMISDARLREQLSANAAESAKRFSWDTSAKIFREVLETVVKKNKKRSLN
jgi:glycosyltransferase involved in cell wall biosynthesis